MALRPFFIVSSTPSTISFLALHLTQYPSGIKDSSAATLHASQRLLVIAYEITVPSVNCENARPKPVVFSAFMANLRHPESVQEKAADTLYDASVDDR
jgi:hypothetical protein